MALKIFSENSKLWARRDGGVVGSLTAYYTSDLSEVYDKIHHTWLTFPCNETSPKKYSDPNKHFCNWADFPELHSAKCISWDWESKPYMVDKHELWEYLSPDVKDLLYDEAEDFINDQPDQETKYVSSFIYGALTSQDQINLWSRMGVVGGKFFLPGYNLVDCIESYSWFNLLPTHLKDLILAYVVK